MNCKDMNLLIISLDALRPDYLGFNKSKKINTPFMDKLASESLVFENTIAQAPYTPPSHATILSGLNPCSHRLRKMNGDRFDPNKEMIQSSLKRNRYKTAAFVSVEHLGRKHGFGKDFDLFDNKGNLIKWAFDDHKVVNDARTNFFHFLEKNKREKFFVFFHYFLIHEGSSEHIPLDYKKKYPEDSKIDFYRSKIEYCDEHFIGALINRLNELKLIDKTIICIVSDHGEGLGDHNEFLNCQGGIYQGHGKFLYNTTLKIVFMLRIPGVAPKKIAHYVSSASITPTIKDILSIKDDIVYDGPSLVPLILGGDQKIPPIISETHCIDETYSIINEGLKLICIGKNALNPIELYDLRNDLAEENNILKDNIQDVDRLKKILLENISFSDPYAMAKEDEKIISKILKSLGYS